VRVVAVERRVDLARALAADERPFGRFRRPGVEEVDGRIEVEPRAPAREQVVVGARRQLAQVDRDEVELDRRQLLVELEHGLRHVHQLRRVRRDDLHDPDPDQRRGIDEVHVLEAALHDGFWELKEARILSATEEPQTHDRYLIASTLQPSQVRQSFVDPDAVPFWDLKETISQMKQADLNTTTYALHYDLLLARPLLFIAMVFVAASVSLRFFRFGGVAIMVLGGVAAGFVLYVATELMAELGASGIISSLVAAWFPAVVGSLLGTLALLYQEDG